MFIVLAIVSFVYSGGDQIWLTCWLSAMIPAVLLIYDERSKWNSYCGTLPYSKSQIVSGRI